MSDPITPAAPAATPVSPTPESNSAPNASAPAAVAADAKATLQDPTATPAQKVEAKKTLKKLTLKVDGQEFEETLPFEIPDTKEAREYMMRELQMGRMGQKRAAESASIKKEVSALIEQMKKDPFKVLSDPAIGLDVKEAIAKFMEKEIENSKKSPEQLELESTREELRRIKEEQELGKKTAEEQERARLAEKYEQEYDTQISQALDANKIPKSAAAVKKILDYAQLAVEANKDVSINDILPIIRDELINDHREHVKALPDDSLEEFYGKELFDRIRKISVAKVKKTAANPALKAPTNAPSTGQGATKPAEPEKKMNYKTFFKM